jgi:hypothetical protein
MPSPRSSDALSGQAGAGSWLRRRARDPRTIVALLVLAGYFIVARLVENLYPFSTFPMYAAEREATASRILARELDGSVHEIDEYAAWSCEEPLDLAAEPDRCAALARYATIPYIDREIEARIRELERAAPMADPAGAPVTLVRRVFRFPDGPGKARVEDCALGRCKAVRR